MIVYDAQRRPLALGSEVGRGGEAAVYRLAGQPAVLAKLYHRAPRPGYDLKLAWMQAHPPTDPTQSLGHASIAWPTQLLYDARGALVGYAMVHVQNAVPLLLVFNPRLRAKTLPNFNRRYLHRTARNLAAALGALHATNYVVGDLNESNVMVMPSALVTLIDADSFQVQRRVGAKPVLHPCPVGKPEYTPPELQGRTFAEVPRQPEHDRFGLAVLVFQLLMEGNHPFRALWLAASDPPPVEARIRDGHWPYASKPGLPIAPPRHAPALDSLHPELATLMRLCFVDGHARPASRPTPEAWERAIATAEKALVTCRQGHFYSRHLAQCPSCAVLAAAAQSPAAQPAPALARVPTAGAAPRLAPSLPGWLAALSRPAAAAVQPARVLCRVCQHANPGDEVYCQNCAARLAGKRACPHCGRGIPQNARFCPRCGLRVV
ncbi:MAG: zinc ribbon domain-containing protein [Anaerolineales bacterium]|nr:zinc ribbon domain-containing protein [Anaerolineales bacterium]